MVAFLGTTSYLLSCSKLLPQLNSLKQQTMITSQNFWGSGIQEQLSWLVLIWSLMRSQSSCWLGLQSAEGLSGAGGYIPSGLFTWLWAESLSSSPHGWVFSSSWLLTKQLIQGRERKEAPLPFTIKTKITHYHFWFILLFRSKSLSLAHTRAQESRTDLLKGAVSKDT